MGSGAFIYASNYSQYGISGTGILGPAGLIVYTLAKILREVLYKCKTGSWTKPEGSAWKHEDGGVRWSSCIPMLANVFATIGYTSVMTLAWRFANMAGMNQGVISSLLNFASIGNCIVFYCAFGERLSWFHLIGIGLMFCSIACIGAAAATAEEKEGVDEVDTGGRSVVINGILALVVGFGGPSITTARHYFIRKYAKNYRGVDMSFDAAAPQHFIFCFFLPSLASKLDIQWSDIFTGLLAIMLMENGRITLAYGVEKGLAGPA